jgi:DNA-binding transcriptional LysR family regulator
MDITWDAAQSFLAIAEGGSMSAGAERLGPGQPTVSRRIALLEARLECALFTRGRQDVSLPEAGTRLRPAAEQMARWPAEFERLAQGTESEATGIVRVAARSGAGVDLLAPLAGELAETHPALRLEVLASIQFLDLARGDADLALRTRPTREPELITLASGARPIGVFVSPRYLGRLHAKLQGKMPRTLADLDWVTWGAPSNTSYPGRFSSEKSPTSSPILRQTTIMCYALPFVQGSAR